MAFSNRHLSRRDVLKLLGAGATTALLAACAGGAAPSQPTSATGGQAAAPTKEPTKPAVAERPPTATPEVAVRQAASGRKSTIEVWYPYGGPSIAVYAQLWDQFEKTHPDIGVKAVYAANDLATNQKLFTAIAGGAPPDISWVDGPQVAEWAERGALTSLDDFFKTAKISADQYWAPSWKQNQYKGKIWAITYGSDANFGFFWNKKVFKDAGLDPEKPPQTIAEMDQFNEKITKIDGDKITRIGIIPWTVYGSSNSMFTWGWAFGGEFYDDANAKITANNENVVKALDWMVGYAKKYDIKKIAGFQQGFGQAENNPFYIGQTAMAPWGNWEFSAIDKYAPKLDYGVTFLPSGPPPAQPKSSWVGGWCIGVPQGSKQSEAAMEFLRWTCASDEGTKFVGEKFGLFPGYKNSPYYTETVTKDPKLNMFYEILKETKHQRPVMPAQAYYTGALTRAVDSALYQEKTAKQALDDATAETQKELDKILKKS